MTALRAVLLAALFLLSACGLAAGKPAEAPVFIKSYKDFETKYATLMKLASPAFEPNGMIPAKYTCDGENISPPLEFSEVSERARSLVLIVDDPDAPSGDWVHWTVWNLPAATTGIPEGGPLPPEAVEGDTDYSKPGWGGPCPPEGTHRYVFHLYAIGAELYLDESAAKAEILEAIDGQIIDQADLVGRYERLKTD